ncbi:glycosyltransferase [Microcoleus sp. MON2_D5]|uniref:glycosyltransferase n=1 Tax=Microcoleus sp. MON2_D5 TaxID=2818833 RepID=UPI002FCE82A6
MNKQPSPGKGNLNVIDSKFPKVSIAIPVYNREKYLGIAVRSVLDQTFTDLELIIVDDGSTDGSLAIAEQFALEDDRVRVLSNPINKGAAHALKKGFDAARGEYIGQVDSDDILEARAIELTAAVLDDDKDCGLVYTNYLDIDENGRKMRPGKRCVIPYSKDRLLIDFMTFHFRLIRQLIYLKAGGFNTEFNNIEDYELCLRLSEVTNIKKIDNYLYQYRFHHRSTKVTMNDMDRVELCRKAITQALKRRGMNTTHKLSISINPTFAIETLI